MEQRRGWWSKGGDGGARERAMEQERRQCMWGEGGERGWGKGTG